jgi:pyruvate/oxaloacetate carboxyltransferase
MVAALKGAPFDTDLDLELLQKIGFYFRKVRKKYTQFESEYTGVDTRVQVNQVPGGMISNLANQLRDQEALTTIDEVLAEIPKIRRDLGYPPLVTPTSQIVGTQAVLNVFAGAGYQNITNEVKLYLEWKAAMVNPLALSTGVCASLLLAIRRLLKSALPIDCRRKWNALRGNWRSSPIRGRRPYLCHVS